MKLGAIDFLAKPTTPDALRRVVAEVIARHAVPATASQPAEAGRPACRIARSKSTFELVRAKRAINRGQFSEAEALLRDVIAADPALDRSPRAPRSPARR